MEPEKPLWEGNPSQIINLPVFLLCALVAGIFVGGALLFKDTLPPPFGTLIAAAAVVPILFGFWRWLQTRCLRYELTSERLHLSHGVLSRRTEDLELYRVKDYVLAEPLSLRMFGLANLVLTTTDDSNQVVTLRAISGAKVLRDEIRKNVEACRDKKRVRVSEFE